MTRSPFGWDYPPGVTGNEPQISGEEDKCPFCGSELAYADEDYDLLMCPTPEKHPPPPVCTRQRKAQSAYPVEKKKIDRGNTLKQS